MNNLIEQKLKHFPYQIILGSASPRRQELLRSLGFDYLCLPINADESWPQVLKAEQIPLYLSEHKSREFPRALSKNELLITADTIVWCEGKIYNKPADFDEGLKMLTELSGRMHEVFTGVTLRSEKKKVSFFDVSKVYFKEFKQEEIIYYLNHYRPFDKAGGYGVQEWLGYIGINRIEGSFYNVMGLPVKQLYEQLMDF